MDCDKEGNGCMLSAQKHRHSVSFPELEWNYNSHIHRITHDAMQEGCFQHFWSAFSFLLLEKGPFETWTDTPHSTHLQAGLLSGFQPRALSRRPLTLQISCAPLYLLRRKTGPSHAEGGRVACLHAQAALLRALHSSWRGCPVGDRASFSPPTVVFILPWLLDVHCIQTKSTQQIFWWTPRRSSINPLEMMHTPKITYCRTL